MSGGESIALAVLGSVAFASLMALVGWLAWLDKKKAQWLRTQAPLWTSRATVQFSDEALTPERIAQLRKILEAAEKRRGEL